MASNMVGWFPPDTGHRIAICSGLGPSGNCTILPVTTSLSDHRQERKIKVADVPLQDGGINIADGKWKSSRMTVKIEIAEDTQAEFKDWVLYFYELFMYHAGNDRPGIRVYDDTSGQAEMTWYWNEVTSFNWTWRRRTKNRVAIVKIGLLSLRYCFLYGLSETDITTEPTKPS